MPHVLTPAQRTFLAALARDSEGHWARAPRHDGVVLLESGTRRAIDLQTFRALLACDFIACDANPKHAFGTLRPIVLTQSGREALARSRPDR